MPNYILLTIPKPQNGSSEPPYNQQFLLEPGKEYTHYWQWFISTDNIDQPALQIDSLKERFLIIGLIALSDRDATRVKEEIRRAQHEDQSPETAMTDFVAMQIDGGASDNSSLMPYLIALEEELAHMGSRYGFTDRARELLSKSPLR